MKDFKADQSGRLQTASHIMGMPRRDTLKQKIIPAMHGVMAGDKARNTMVQIDRTLDSMHMQ